ncbi:hypothetical protein SBA4_3440002 [Candidatus Sulfopaludibacter sp. SbA4]|nr:hypothetical protein SBA4_3440002 [Candidatus Sulfopaludibacter sp. SbA4]
MQSAPLVRRLTLRKPLDNPLISKRAFVGQAGSLLADWQSATLRVAKFLPSETLRKDRPALIGTLFSGPVADGPGL